MSSGRLFAFFHSPFLHPLAPRQSERDSWPEVTATVADCFDLSDLLEKPTVNPVYSVRFNYWVDGRMYSGCFKTHSRHAEGEWFSVHYDPRYPERNSTDPEEKLRTGLLVAASFALMALYVALAWHR